jgi:hypothetical protein
LAIIRLGVNYIILVLFIVSLNYLILSNSMEVFLKSREIFRSLVLGHRYYLVLVIRFHIEWLRYECCLDVFLWREEAETMAGRGEMLRRLSGVEANRSGLILGWLILKC